MAKIFRMIFVMAILVALVKISLWVKDIVSEVERFHYNYILTIYAEADGKEFSGSSVISVTQTFGPAFLGEANTDGEVPRGQGEAIYIDLGTRDPLIMTWRRNNCYGIGGMAIRAFAGPLRTRTDWINTARRLEHLHASAEIAPSELCRFVTFSNIQDPTSLREIGIKDVPDVIGSGVRIKFAKVEMTDAEISRNIENKLPWLKRMKAGQKLDMYWTGRSPPYSELVGKFEYQLDDFIYDVEP